MDRTPHLPEQWGGQCLLLSDTLGNTDARSCRYCRSFPRAGTVSLSSWIYIYITNARYICPLSPLALWTWMSVGAKSVLIPISSECSWSYPAYSEQRAMGHVSS